MPLFHPDFTVKICDRDDAISSSGGLAGCYKGQCINGTCVCNSGWVHDNVFLTIENCAQPSITYELMLVATILSFLVATKMYSECYSMKFDRRNQHHQFDLHLNYACVCAQVLIMSLYKWYGTGMNPFCLFLYVIIITIILQSYFKLYVYAFLIASCESVGVNATPVIQRFKRFYIMIVVFTEFAFILAFVLTALAYYEVIDSKLYNDLWVLVFALMAIVCCIVTATFIHPLNVLLGSINSSIGSDKTRNRSSIEAKIVVLRRRLLIFRRGLIICFPYVGLCWLVITVCYIFFDSIPLLFILMFSIHITCPVLNLLVIYIINKKASNAIKRQSRAAAAKLDNDNGNSVHVMAFESRTEFPDSLAESVREQYYIENTTKPELQL